MIPRDQEVWHPILDSLSIVPESAIHVRRQVGAAAPSILSDLAQRIDARVTEARIGALEGPSEYLFGELVDGGFLPGGRIALLDRQAMFLRVYDSIGAHLFSLGGPGEGPGEFDFPVAALMLDSADLWVVEGARGIQRFHQAGGGFEFKDRIQLNSFSVRDACVIGEHVIVHIPSHVTRPDQVDATDAPVLFRYGPNGQDRFGFAVPYRYSPWLAAERMKRGQIACGAHDRVFLAFEYQNRLDSYRTSDGDLLWHATFDGIHIPRLREQVGPEGKIAVGVDVRGGEPTLHFLLGLAGGQGNPLIIQFGRRTRDQILSQVDSFDVETFLIDVETGEGLYLGEGLPRVLALEGDHLLLLRTDPFPEVEVARMPASGIGREPRSSNPLSRQSPQPRPEPARPGTPRGSGPPSGCRARPSPWPAPTPG